MNRIPKFLLLAAILAGVAVQTEAYVLLGPKWKQASATMQLQLVKPANALPLIDRSASFNASAASALSHWNPRIKTFKFARVLNSTAAKGLFNTRNNVFFSNTIYGRSFGSTTLAVCITMYLVGPRPQRTTETDVIFNTRFRWNSYTGTPRPASNPGVDFRRVAIHEFGHALGLGHSNAVAIMRPVYGSIFTAQADDIRGAQALYGVGP